MRTKVYESNAVINEISPDPIKGARYKSMRAVAFFIPLSVACIFMGAGCVPTNAIESTLTVSSEQPAEEVEEVKFITLATVESLYQESPIKFVGVVSPNTQTIVVTAKYGGKTDVYALQDYDAGDTSFYYGAAEKWNNLASGTNVYSFVAYFDDGTTETVTKSITYEPRTAETVAPTAVKTTPTYYYIPPSTSSSSTTTSCCKVCSREGVR